MTTDDRGTGSASLAISVDADVSGTVRLVLEDTVLDDRDRWAVLAAGTTPYTLERRLRAQPTSLRYEGDDVGARVTHVVSLQVEDPTLEVPRVGLVTVTFEPDRDGGDVPPPVGVRIGAWPATLDTLPASVDHRTLSLRASSSWPGVDALRAILPRVIDRDELTMAVSTVNTGDAAAAARTTLTLERSGPAGTRRLRADEDAVLTVAEGAEQLLLPGETSTTQVLRSRVDDLPVLGFVRLEATTTATLGANESVTTVGRTYLVAPWWEAASIAMLVLVGAVGWRVRHRLRPAAPVSPVAPVAPESPAAPAAPAVPTMDAVDLMDTAAPAPPASAPEAPWAPWAPWAPAPEAPEAPEAPQAPDTDTDTDTDTDAKRIVAEILARIETDRASARTGNDDPAGTEPVQREPGTW